VTKRASWPNFWRVLPSNSRPGGTFGGQQAYFGAKKVTLGPNCNMSRGATDFANVHLLQQCFIQVDYIFMCLLAILWMT